MAAPRRSDIRELSPSAERTATPKVTVSAPREPAMPAEAARRGVAVTNHLNKALVAAYKLVGFTLLTIILVGLFAYVALNGLFFLHDRWVAPAIIAPSDLRVLELRARLAHELWNRQKVDAELARVVSDLKHARRTVAMEEQYQDTFQTAVNKNASIQWGRLKDFKRLQQELQSVQENLDKATTSFSRERGQSVAAAYEANLIDKQQKATEDFRMAELEAKRMQLQQQDAQLTQQLSELTQQASALGSVARQPTDSAPATFEGLQLKRTFLNSVLQKERAGDEVAALEAARTALGEALKGYDEVLSIIRESPLLLAASGELMVAFVPYENLAEITEGDPVYGCLLQVIGCEVVGQVGVTIEGEVTAKHPVYGSDLRGKFVRLELTDEAWARESVLHIGRAPLFL